MSFLRKIKTRFGYLFSKNGELPANIQSVKEYEIKETGLSFLYEGTDVENLAERLLQLFEREKPFLNPKLKLASLAIKLNTNRNYLSRTINKYMQINFSQLCNYFRVREACMVFLANPDIDRQEWIKMSGFCSSSSFSGCFSNYTGISPARWQKEVLQRIKRKEYISADDYIKDFKYTLLK